LSELGPRRAAGSILMADVSRRRLRQVRQI
jgi:hypothetical protein